MTPKKIHNPSTGKYYAIRQKTTSSGRKGQIIGSYESKAAANSVKTRYSKVIKKLGST